MSSLFDAVIAEELEGMALDPVNLRRLMLMLTRAHFSNPANYGPLYREEYRNFRWEDSDNSPMMIEPDMLEDIGVEERPPAIYVGLGDISFAKEVIDYHVAATESTSGNHRTSGAVTQIILQCVSRRADEALALAAIASGFFSMVREPLKNRVAAMRDMRMEQISRVAKVDPKEPKSAAKSDLTLRFLYDFNWTTEVESHTIKTITFDRWKQMAAY